ncbi:MAG: hypothetical protein P8Y42_19755 [Exilibacterium sp.]
MKALFKLCIVLTFPFIWGCATAPQPNVNFTANYWDQMEAKIGVYVGPVPEVKGHLSGANCLLCLAAASVVNSDLANHMKTQSNESLVDLKELLIAEMEKKGAQVLPIETPIDFKSLPKNSSKAPNSAKINFKSIGEQYEVDKILILDYGLIGTMRDFSNYIPVGDPYAIFNALVYVVDTNTNTYDFYEPVNVTKYSETPWKEEGFPGITNAFYTALELGKSRVLDLETDVPIAPVAAAESSEADKSVTN